MNVLCLFFFIQQCITTAFPFLLCIVLVKKKTTLEEKGNVRRQNEVKMCPSYRGKCHNEVYQATVTMRRLIFAVYFIF